MNEPHDPALERTTEFWEARHRVPQHVAHDNFLDHPLVQGYVSLRAFGDLTPHLDAVVAELRNRTRPGGRILSLGCGAAAKEIVLATALPDREFVASDAVTNVLAEARTACEQRGIRNLTLEVGDFNRLALEPNSFDAITMLGALHHVEALENFWDQARRALRPGGSVLAQEYVGPNRMQWTPAQIAAGNEVLRSLPPEHTPHHREVVPTPVAEMLALDPSEAVRSADILQTCRAAGFELLGYAGVGCALLQPVLMYQVHTFDPRNWEHNRVLMQVFVEEDRRMRRGELGDDFAMFIAAPR